MWTPPATISGAIPRVGPYRLISEIGHGGMGTVYLAVRADAAFEQRVAIKILKRGMDTDAIAARFRHERQILASLTHPNIARLLDGGTTSDGLPYFAMEYVDGRQLVDYCESRGLDTSARLAIFRQVCAAVQYAHQNLIIHRDLKPANVLVAMDGTPKLLDFGIAKLLNADVAGHTHAPTVAGMQLMTPEYASPEQVRGDPVTTATDVYSLGVLLYELLTGRRPYRITSRAPIDVARVVCEAVPARPSTAVTNPSDGPDAQEPITGAETVPTREVPSGQLRAVEAQRLSRRLAGDLDTIVLKALSKEPARRYPSVDQFSEDVRRHLEGLPVLARRDTWNYRAAKFIRRHRAAVGAAALTFLALVAGVIGTAWQAREARIARARAEARFDDVRRLANAFVFDMHDAIRDLPGSDTGAASARVEGARVPRPAGARGRRTRRSAERAGVGVRAGSGTSRDVPTCRTWAIPRARLPATARRPPSTSRSARRRRKIDRCAGISARRISGSPTCCRRRGRPPTRWRSRVRGSRSTKPRPTTRRRPTPAARWSRATAGWAICSRQPAIRRVLWFSGGRCSR